MNRSQLEKLYEVNGLDDYRLKTTEDLLKVHGIDFQKVDGYSRLDDLNKQLYKKFIINYFNGYGLDTRVTMFPKGIHFVEDIEYLAKEDPEDECFTVIGGKVLALDARTGLKFVLHSWQDEEYNHLVEEFPEAITESKPKRYLRFEYEINRYDEWQHVVDEKTWY